MAKLTLDDRIVALLDADAQKHGVSREERAATILREVLEDRATRRARLSLELDRIAAMTPPSLHDADTTVLIREDRDR